MTESGTNPPAQRPPPPGRGMEITGLVLAILGFLAGWIPYAGYLGVVAIIVGLSGFLAARVRSAGYLVATVILGVISTAAAIVWTVVIASGCCPHVYAFDGTRWELEADMLSGSFLAAAEGEDLARLERAAPSDGRYLLRVANERQERDHLDQARMLVVDHAPGLSALPSADGGIVLLDPPRVPSSARDATGRDLLPALAAEDGQTWRGWLEDHDPGEAAPRDVVELTLPGVGGGEAWLVLRARNTQEATDAMYRYLGEMGPGLGSLLRWAEESERYPYRQRIADEIERMGIPLRIEVRTEAGWVAGPPVRPLGPAAMRTVAVPLPAGLPRDGVKVRLTASPRFWEIDRVAIASSAGRAQPQTLTAARAVDGEGRSVDALLAAADGRRLLVPSGAQVTLEFPAPAPAPGSTRSVFLELRGYYEVDIGGRGWLNPVAIWRHRSGADSLPRYVVRTLRSGG